MFQLPRGTRAFKQGLELPRPISKGKLDFSSSLILARADLCENWKIWQGNGCQMGKSASETSRNTLQTLQFQDNLGLTLRYDHVFKRCDKGTS